MAMPFFLFFRAIGRQNFNKYPVACPPAMP
jgi:hypothetical protein